MNRDGNIQGQSNGKLYELTEWGAIYTLTAGFAPMFSGGRRTGHNLRFPEFGTFSFDPVTRVGVPFEVSIPVPIAFLQELQQRVPESRIHPDVLAGEITSHAMTRETLFEESFFV